MKAKTQQIKAFHGLNHSANPLRLPAGWLQVADNVDVTQTGAVVRRNGFTKVADGAFSGGFSTQDFSRFYVVDAGSIQRVHPDLSRVTIKSGLSDAPMHWCEVNRKVFYSNGVDNGVINADDLVDAWSWPFPGTPDIFSTSGNLPAGKYGVCCTYLLPDGRETGAGIAANIELQDMAGLSIRNIPQVDGLTTHVYIAPADSTVFQSALTTDRAVENWQAGPDALGVDLVTQFLDAPPERGILPTFWGGRVWLAEHFQDKDISALWASEPLGFHLFNDFISVPGKVVMLAAHSTALIVGTEQAIYAWNGELLATLCSYGSVPGWNGINDDETGDLYFWTQRGLCAAMPFRQITESYLRPDPGVQASTAIIQQDGTKKLIATTVAGGAIFNQRSQSS